MENNIKAMKKAAVILEKYYNSNEVQEWLNTPLGAFDLTEEKRRSTLKPKLYALYNFCIKILVKYHLWRSSKFRIAPKGYTEKQADDIWWKHNSKTQTLIEKLKRI